MPRLTTVPHNYSYNLSINSDTLPKTLPPSGSTPSFGNLHNATDRTPKLRKLPLKTSSVSLPIHNQLASNDGSPKSLASVPKRSFRAAEEGKRDILPAVDPVSVRVRSFTETRWGFQKQEQTPTQTQSLRSRRRTVGMDDILSGLDSSNNRHNRHLPPDGAMLHKPVKVFKSDSSLDKIITMKPIHWLPMIAALLITCVVWDSYAKAAVTMERLEKFSEDENMMKLHLQRIEQQSIQLHENLSRLTDGVVNRKSDQSVKSEPIDAELLRVQTQQLYEMEQELSHDLRSLQTKLQQVARNSIIDTYGEGPVQTVLELVFPDGQAGPNQISILLWYDTPYAAWTLLQLVQKGVLTGASFKFGRGYSIAAVPTTPDTDTKLDFMEKAQKSHEPWTVGLTEYEGGGLTMFINLQDNSNYFKHDVCVGKVIDGFDALQRLVGATKSLSGTDFTVTIREATASHLAKARSGII